MKQPSKATSHIHSACSFMRCVLSLLSEAGMVQPHLALHSNRLENFQDYLKKAMSASINPYSCQGKEE